MARVSNKGKGRGGIGQVSKRNRNWTAQVKSTNRKLDLARKS
jgi:hypothetical protein